MVLREEEPVVAKRAVPKERVRLETETVTEERQVADEVRKERIEVVTVVGAATGGSRGGSPPRS